MDKREIRKEISDRKKEMNTEAINTQSEELTAVFCSLPEYQDAGCIFAYVSFNQEVRTDGIINRAIKDGKRVAVPKVEGKNMTFRYINSLDDCVPGYSGILEPPKVLMAAEGNEENVLMLMPGLAFDRSGNRIGYGGGYYDRYLEQHSKVRFTKIALGYQFQLYEKLKVEEFDMKADIIITPNDIIRVNA